MSGEIEGLRKELRATPPPSVEGLTAEELETLSRLLRAAREQQRAALERAIDDGLGFLPRLLRGPVKRALVG
jgi:hypothetical protein